ncbi:Ribosome inactivating protein [Streptomyces sp. DconLS]|nr:Ribosome inactivating protein [Streptomyces sp. LamerLS-31b]SCF90742.1 Ribosome inactivating protein [Streptomyces sp. DconLS]
MAIGIGATGTAPAQADTYQWWVSHVYMNVGDNASAGQQAQYAGLITSLRNAAGHSWRSGVMPTQTPASHALIRLDLSHSGATLQLWFTPDNLYLRGFTTAAGTTFTFNDYDLRAAMQPATAVGNNGLLPPRCLGGLRHVAVRLQLQRPDPHGRAEPLQPHDHQGPPRSRRPRPSSGHHRHPRQRQRLNGLRHGAGRGAGAPGSTPDAIWAS